MNLVARLALFYLPLQIVSGCGLTAAKPAPVDYVLFLDETGSVTAGQRAAWAATADAVLGRLSFSDTILIFPVHDRTSQAAPIFKARVPSPGSTLRDLARAKKGLREIRDAALQSVHDALASAKQATSTDLYALVDRVAASRSNAQDRITRVYVFSDMLHSGPPVDLERIGLATTGIPVVVDKVRQHRRWSDNAMAGAKVFCVLNGIDAGGRATLNSRRDLEEFWRALLTSVGGEIVSFDTYLRQE
jgi:hypothetical protein